MSYLLASHIIVSLAMLAGATGLFLSAWMRKQAGVVRRLVIISWGVSFGSGIGLVVYGASFTHFCATMSAASLLAIAADRFYAHRLKTSFSTPIN